MTKSLNAPLSPNEEITLRRVALDASNSSNLSPRDMARLHHLMLVVTVNDRPELTPLGRQRYQALTRPVQFTDAPETDIAVLLRRIMTNSHCRPHRSE